MIINFLFQKLNSVQFREFSKNVTCSSLLVLLVSLSLHAAEQVHIDNATTIDSVTENSKVIPSKVNYSEISNTVSEANSNALLLNTQDDLRIIALAPHIVEMLFELGLGDYIVGTVEYADYPEQANSIERVGGYYGMQIEKILALAPDIIFAWQSGNKVDDLAQLRRLNMNVVSSKPDKIDDVATELRYFSKVTHDIVDAKENISTDIKKLFLAKLAQHTNTVSDNFESKLAFIREKYQDKESVDVFYQLWPKPMRTVNKNTWIHQVIEICRGRNVFADNSTDYPQISIENVLVAQPHIIILPDEKSETPQPTIQWQQWPEIPAVTANAYIGVNADLLHRFSPRMLSGVEQLCADMEAYR